MMDSIIFMLARFVINNKKLQFRCLTSALLKICALFNLAFLPSSLSLSLTSLSCAAFDSCCGSVATPAPL